MNKNTWAPIAGWIGAIAVAVGLAFAVPNQGGNLGKVPPVAAKRLDQTAVQFPQALPTGRTLALITFKADQRAEAQSWIDGLHLRDDKAIQWLKMPVYNDRDAAGRDAIEARLLERYPQEAERARLLPVFTDREAFVRAVGLSGHNRASVLVLDRDGNVLARVEGAYDEMKARALRETVLAQND